MDDNYHSDLQTARRTDLTPLDIVQPQGPSFTVEGNLVKWQKWSLRVDFNYREGLVLHQARRAASRAAAEAAAVWGGAGWSGRFAQWLACRLGGGGGGYPSRLHSPVPPNFSLLV